MKANILNILILYILIIQILAHKGEKNATSSNSSSHTFLVKSKLTKDQLQTLLNQGETHLLNLRKKNGTQTAEVKNTTNTSTVKEVNETSENDDDYSLLKEIEEEIMDHALNPLEEFHVKPTKTSEAQTLVVKPNTKFIDSLYEKRFGRIYGYLTLLLFVFVLIYNKDFIFNQKINDKYDKYDNLFNLDSSKEYMLVKQN